MDTRLISFRIPIGLLDYLDAVAKRERRSRAQEIVKRLVESSSPEKVIAPVIVAQRDSLGDRGGFSASPPKPRKVDTAKAVEKEVGPLPKYGEKCRHGYMNWMVCPECNPK